MANAKAKPKVPGTGGDNLPKVPKFADLEQMSNVELDMILTELKSAKMTLESNKARGLMPAGGSLRNIRTTIARVLTIKQKRG